MTQLSDVSASEGGVLIKSHRFPDRKYRLIRIVGWVLTAIYMALVGFITLWPSHVDANPTGGAFHQWLNQGHAEGWLPGWFTYELVEWCANVVMFAPGGFLLCLLLSKSWRWWVPLMGLFATCGIETVQLFMPGRTSSLLDVLANSLGSLLGWCLGLIVLLWCEKRRKQH